MEETPQDYDPILKEARMYKSAGGIIMALGAADIVQSLFTGTTFIEAIVYNPNSNLIQDYIADAGFLLIGPYNYLKGKRMEREFQIVNSLSKKIKSSKRSIDEKV